jgi:hypothetical protein
MNDKLYELFQKLEDDILDLEKFNILGVTKQREYIEKLRSMHDEIVFYILNDKECGR